MKETKLDFWKRKIRNAKRKVRESVAKKLAAEQAATMSNLKILFDTFCYKVNCENYAEWSYDTGVPHTCVSCIKVGQSYNIDTYPENCPHLKEIKKYELQIQQEVTWSKLQTINK